MTLDTGMAQVERRRLRGGVSVRRGRCEQPELDTPRPLPSLCLPMRRLRVRVEIMGPQKCRIVGKSQSLHMMIDPMISTRTRRGGAVDARLE
jgi:hypothetical protein